MSDGSIGYVICGYLDSEGPEGITVEADQITARPFESAEDAWAEVEAAGGSRQDATIIIGRVVPVGLIAHHDATDEDILDKVGRVEGYFGMFESSDDDGALLVSTLDETVGV